MPWLAVALIGGAVAGVSGALLWAFVGDVLRTDGVTIYLGEPR